MANIKQQKKRIGIAQRQRLENLRYQSTAKTLFRSLQAQVDGGDTDAAAETHRELVRLLDRGTSRNAFHRNTAARKKARAARILREEAKQDPATLRRGTKKATGKGARGGAAKQAKAAAPVADDAAPAAEAAGEGDGEA